MTAINDEAVRVLLERLGNAWAFLVRGSQSGEHHKARAADIVITDVLENAPRPVLEAAVRRLTGPDHPRPIPVVLGPQDVAAVVGRDEVMALVSVYAQAVMAWSSAHAAGASNATELAGTCHRTRQAVQAAVERLCLAAPAYELGGGRSA